MTERKNFPAAYARQPTDATLKKYGLTVEEWQEICGSQHGVCAVCEHLPPSGTLHIDHEHVRGFKQMQPWQRRKFVRGLLCFTCNAFILARGATPQKLYAAAKYLEKWRAA